MATSPEAPGERIDDQRRVVDLPGGTIALDLFVVSQHLGELLDIALTGTGVTPSEYAVYSLLGTGPRTHRELGRTLGLRPGTLSGYLATMDRRRHLARRPHETDGRSRHLTLTATGRETYEQCRRRMTTAMTTLRACLGGSARTEQLRTVLATIDDGVVGATRQLAAGSPPPER